MQRVLKNRKMEKFRTFRIGICRKCKKSLAELGIEAQKKPLNEKGICVNHTTKKK
jgi:hypothetical protein